MIVLLLIGTIFLAIFHSPFWLIATAVLAIFQIQRYRYYAGTPWRRAFFRLRRIYDVENAKAHAEDPELTSSRMKWLGFLTRFYKVVYHRLQDDEIQQRFDQIEKCITNFSDHDGIENVLRRKFSKADEQRIHRVLDAFKSEMTHIDNRLAMLKIFVMADIIGRETNNQGRLEFLYTVLAEPKTINF